MAQIELEKNKQSMALELEKLEYENADSEHKRKMELMEKNRVSEQAQEEVKKQLAAVVRNEEREEAEKQHQRRLELAEKLTVSKEDLDNFYAKYLSTLDTLSKKADTFLQERQEFRKGMIEDFLDALNTSDIGIIQKEYDINEDDLERIKRIVDAKFPILETDVPLSPKLKKLIDLICG